MMQRLQTGKDTRAIGALRSNLGLAPFPYRELEWDFLEKAIPSEVLITK